MTCLEIDKAMYDIVCEKYNECQGRLDAVPKENQSERKALIIEREMYGLCNRAGMLVYVLGKRESVLATRKRVIGQILQRYPRLNKVYTQLDEEEKTKGVYFGEDKNKLKKGTILAFSKECKNKNFEVGKKVAINRYETISYGDTDDEFFVSEKAIVAMF